jgi:hypothetical protein
MRTRLSHLVFLLFCLFCIAYLIAVIGVAFDVTLSAAKGLSRVAQEMLRCAFA